MWCMAGFRKHIDGFLVSSFVKRYWTLIGMAFTLYKIVSLVFTPNWSTCLTLLVLIMAQLIGFLAYFAFTTYRKRMLELAERDMKMFFEKGSVLHQKIISGLELNEDSSSEEVKFIKASKYPKEDLSLEKMVTSEYINIRLLEDKDKEGKCIIQAGFIPIDRNGKMLLIHRTDHRAEYLKLADNTGKKKKVHSFTVSFSPIPDRFDDKFDKNTIYHREVPKTDTEPEFIEAGLGINNWNNDDQQKKSYLFFFYFAYYKDLEFNENNLQKLFAKDGVYFLKDHDEIEKVVQIGELDKENIHLMKIEKAALKYIKNNNILDEIVKNNR